MTSLSNEKLAVQVGIILANHAVGVLIIDEIQARNFNEGARGELARTFFLRLLNFGIPILLMGNPLGMEVLNSFSQDVRRLGSSGTIHMHPIERDHPDYAQILAPAIWNYNVLPSPPSIHDPDGSLLFRYCGGIRDYGCRVLHTAQRIALDLDEESLTQEHLDLAFNGPDFSVDDRRIIRAFVNKDAASLSKYEDIPWEFYLGQWMPSVPAELQEQPEVSEADTVRATGSIDSANLSSGTTYAQQNAQTIKTNRSKAAKQKERIDGIKATLNCDDMRLEGIKNHLISDLSEACVDGY